MRKARERGRVPWWRPQVLLQASPRGLRSLEGCKIRKWVCPEETQGHRAQMSGERLDGAQGSFWANMSALDLGVLSV